MRLIVIGNSHLAALKLAWGEHSTDFADTELVFFGGPGDSLSDLVIQNRCLVPVSAKTAEFFRFTSGGSDKIDCSGFDGVLLHGLHHIRILLPALYTHVSGYKQNEDCLNISRGCLTQIVVDRLKEKGMLAMLREVTALPIFVAPAPYPTRDCLNGEKGKWDVLKMKCNYLMVVRDSFVEGGQLVCREFEAQFLPQPEETIEDFLFTKACFSKESVRLSGLAKGHATPHKEHDFTHMNMAFGHAVLKSVLPHITSVLSKG